MTQPFLGQIQPFGFGFAPRGWALCNGQILSIAQNTALFALLGTMYGGNGTTTFALPNLQGSAPMQAGQGPGLSLRDLGEIGGEQTVTLLQTEMPAHAHTIQAASGTGLNDPTNNSWASGAKGFGNVYSASNPAINVQMSPFALSISGGNLPHNNMMPFLGLTFIIALQGVFPARS
jgi:microcystin-dependent protein